MESNNEKQISERERTEREIREATRVLHLALGRDPDRALDRCSKAEFERLKEHVQMVSEYYRNRDAELKAKTKAAQQ